MKLFIDKEGKTNYDCITEKTTIDELLQAVDEFLKVQPLPCDDCEESCCKKSWSVEMDNVCVNRLCEGDSKKAQEFVVEKLGRKKNYYRDFYQYVVKKDTNCIYITEENRCLIYEERPIICRLYICCSKSFRYNLLREIIGSTYLKALVIEDRMNRYQYPLNIVKRYKRNPAIFARDYTISIDDVIKYAYDEGWLDEEEKEMLYENLL